MLMAQETPAAAWLWAWRPGSTLLKAQARRYSDHVKGSNWMLEHYWVIPRHAKEIAQYKRMLFVLGFVSLALLGLAVGGKPASFWAAVKWLPPTAGAAAAWAYVTWHYCMWPNRSELLWVQCLRSAWVSSLPGVAIGMGLGMALESQAWLPKPVLVVPLSVSVAATVALLSFLLVLWLQSLDASDYEYAAMAERSSMLFRGKRPSSTDRT